MFKTNLKKRLGINIVPMIDVIFFLLVFFMLFTTFKTTPYGIDLKLPKATYVEKTQSSNIIVNITSDGNLYLKDRIVTIDQLKTEIKPQLVNKPETVVILKADENAKYKSLVQVMDAVRDIGGFNFALAADKETLNNR